MQNVQFEYWWDFRHFVCCEDIYGQETEKSWCFFMSKFRTSMHSIACVAWQFRRALLSGKDAKVHTTGGKADCPDPWPFQLLPPSTHFDTLLRTCLVSISPANQRYDSKRFEIKCWQAKHDSKACDNVKRDLGVCLNKQRFFCYLHASSKPSCYAGYAQNSKGTHW